MAGITPEAFGDLRAQLEDMQRLEALWRQMISEGKAADPSGKRRPMQNGRCVSL